MSTNHYLVVSWTRWLGRRRKRLDRPKCTMRVCWAVKYLIPFYLGTLGTLSQSRPRSPPYFILQLLVAVAIRTLLLVVRQFLNPVVVDAGRKECCQAEEETYHGRLDCETPVAADT